MAMQTGLDAHEGEKSSNKTFRVTSSFLKLTPEACHRMWRRVRRDTFVKDLKAVDGDSTKMMALPRPYQLEPKWLHLIMGFKNNAKRIRENTTKLNKA
jgi:hypothetical protein